MQRCHRLILGVFAALVLSGPLQAAERPQRVATMGLCTDQLVMMLADPDQIVSVHWVTQDPADSAMAAEAARYPANHGQAEEILALEPDLVFAGSFNSPFAKAMLEQQGVKVVVIPAATSFADVRRNIRRVAAALGVPQRGKALIASFDRNLATTKNALRGDRYRALVYGANGYSAGAPSLFNDVMRHVGLRNAAAGGGRMGWVKMSVEAVVEENPDLLILGEYRPRAQSEANLVLQHPALRHLRRGKPVVEVPTVLWNCGTPLLAEAARRLVAGTRPQAARLESK